jgi:hypothetical protein
MGVDFFPFRDELPGRRRMCCSTELSYRPDMTSAAGSAIEAVRRRSRPGGPSATGVDVHFQPGATTSTGSSVLSELLADG